VQWLERHQAGGDRHGWGARRGEPHELGRDGGIHDQVGAEWVVGRDVSKQLLDGDSGADQAERAQTEPM
jgi:hypothetical protein